MKKMSSWLITIFIIMFWAFRLIVAFASSMELNFPIKPIDLTVEMISLFVTFFAILLIVKRSLIGGIIYAATNIYYFGTYAYKFISESGSSVSIDAVPDLFMAMVALILAVAILMDLALNKDRHEGKDNKDTYWFYKNKKYDRELDERADKNQYRL